MPNHAPVGPAGAPAHPPAADAKREEKASAKNPKQGGTTVQGGRGGGRGSGQGQLQGLVPSAGRRSDGGGEGPGGDASVSGPPAKEVTVEDVLVVSSWAGGMKQQGEGQTLVKRHQRLCTVTLGCGCWMSGCCILAGCRFQRPLLPEQLMCDYQAELC
jgi:hypothetical protein